jgi:hypothetical protein
MYRKSIVLFTLAAILVTACNAPSVAPSPTPHGDPLAPTPEIFIPVPEEGRALDAARDAIAQQLGVDISVITVRKLVPEDWPDSCLGLTRRGQACQLGNTPGYRIVLEVNGAVYEVRTDASAQTVMVAGRVDSTLGGLPDVCQGTGLLTYYAPENGFCFAYPGSFTLGETSPVRASIFSPALDQNLDPVRASLQFEIRPLNAGEDLKSVVDAYLAEFAGLSVPEIKRTSTTLGGEPAEQLEVVPGREGSRDVFMVRDGTLFHFMFMPSVTDFPQAASDVEDLFITVTSSFTFLQ